MEDERTSWDRKYARGSHHSLETDEFFLYAFEQFVEPLFPRGGTALDIAGGIGRHAIWLAKRGWEVTLVDISEIGVAKARENAGNYAARINFRVADLMSFRSTHKYDLVLIFFYLQRKLFPELMKSIQPSGLLIYKTYTELQRKFKGGPTHPMHLLKQNELLRAFSKLGVFYYRETVHDRGLAELVAQKCKTSSWTRGLNRGRFQII